MTFFRQIGSLVFGAALFALTPSSPADAEKLNIGYVSDVSAAQLFVIQGEGWFDESEIEVETTPVRSIAAMEDALADGQFDLAYVDPAIALALRSDGQDIKLVAASRFETVALLTRGHLARILTEAPTIADGFHEYARITASPVKIATLSPGSAADTVLWYYLTRRIGVDMADIHIASMDASRVRNAVFYRGADAAAAETPVLSWISGNIRGTVVIAGGSQMMPGHPGTVLAARDRTLADKAETVATLVDLHKRATDLINTEPKRAFAHVQAALATTKTAARDVSQAMSSPFGSYISDPRIIRDGTALLYDVLWDAGDLSAPVTMDALFDLRFHNAGD